MLGHDLLRLPGSSSNEHPAMQPTMHSKKVRATLMRPTLLRVPPVSRSPS